MSSSIPSRTKQSSWKLHLSSLHELEKKLCVVVPVHLAEIGRSMAISRSGNFYVSKSDIPFCANGTTTQIFTNILLPRDQLYLLCNFFTPPPPRIHELNNESNTIERSWKYILNKKKRSVCITTTLTNIICKKSVWDRMKKRNLEMFSSVAK